MAQQHIKREEEGAIHLHSAIPKTEIPDVPPNSIKH